MRMSCSETRAVRATRAPKFGLSTGPTAAHDESEIAKATLMITSFVFILYPAALRANSDRKRRGQTSPFARSAAARALPPLDPDPASRPFAGSPRAERGKRLRGLNPASA